MANWSDLKAAVASIVKTNGNKEITGQLLQNVLNNIISNVGLNSSFAGIATPETNPGTPDGNVFYLAATAGTYSNFNGILIEEGEAVILEWRGSWTKKSSGFATQENLSKMQKETEEKLSELGSELKKNYANCTVNNDSDLDISDEKGNVISRFKNGEFETAKFSSAAIKQRVSATESKVLDLDSTIKEMPSTTESEDSDLNISDEKGNVIAKFINGGIETSKFSSENMVERVQTMEKLNGEQNTDNDLDIVDEEGNIIVSFSGGHIKTKNFDSRNTKDAVKILFVGNSFAMDAVSYIPTMLKELGIGFKIGILYHSGCTLKMHVENDGTQYYTLYTNNGNGWVSANNKTLKDGVISENWDYISFQQGSSISGLKDYETQTKPYLSQLIEYVKDYLNDSEVFDGNVKLVWLATPAYSNETIEKYIPTKYADSDEMWEDIIANSKKVIEDFSVIDSYIPESTFVQNGRHNDVLKNYGGFDSSGNPLENGGSLFYDGHLSEGIAIQLANYAVAYYIFGVQPTFNKTRIDTNSNILEGHGNLEGISDENCFIAQKCAMAAIKNREVITL